MAVARYIGFGRASPARLPEPGERLGVSPTSSAPKSASASSPDGSAGGVGLAGACDFDFFGRAIGLVSPGFEVGVDGGGGVHSIGHAAPRGVVEQPPIRGGAAVASARENKGLAGLDSVGNAASVACL